MITDRYKNKMFKIKVIIFVAIITHSSTKVNCNENLTTELYAKKTPEDGPEARENFSPRVDYNEWMPVGRGDPLKNDPTYDYSPPVLNRVRYWAGGGTGDLNKYEQNVNTGTGVTSPVSGAIATGKKENKNEILLLGVPSKRQSYRKETKYQPQNTIRRSYYVVHHNLPTHLMPPPMQTIAPISISSGNNGKSSTTEMYQNKYHHQSSSSHSHMGNGATTATLASSHYENPTWGYNKYPYDTNLEESKNYVSITKPDVSVAPSAPSASAMIKPIQDMTVTHQPHFKRKPWIHELLQKEITPKIPNVNYVSKPPTKIVHHETHLYYHHTPPQPISFTTVTYPPTDMIPTTTTVTTERPTPAYFQPTTLPPEVTTDSLFSHYKQPEKPIHGPMYLIIEGHSKVKTYGRKDNETIHMPKIRPVVMKDQDSVIKHVVLKDDSGKEIEVKHLHKSTTTESNFHLIENLIEKDSTIEETKPSSAPISNLLSLFDSSFGNFFAGESIKYVKTNSTVEKPKNRTETENFEDKQSNDMIFVTTQIPLMEDHKESRQIFDYDQLTESSIFDIFGGGDYDEDENLSQTEIIEPNSKYLMDKLATNMNGSDKKI